MTTRALVIGGGPAGLAAADGLAGWCGSVTVIDAGPRCQPRRAGEHLPPAGLSALASLGFEDLLVDGRHEDSPGVRSAWGHDGFVDKEYFGSAAGRGLNLRRGLFDEALAQRVERRGAALRFCTRLLALVARPGGYLATVLGPQGRLSLEVDIVVDASGRAAIGARRLGARRRRFDPLIGLVGWVHDCGETDEPGRVHVESAEDGWWYGVQFAGGALLATYLTDVAQVRAHPQRAPGLWRQRLQHSRLLMPMARTGRWSGRLQTFDAATQWLECGELDGFIAVGDAAAACDPLSSWGISKGLGDGHAGVAALARQRSGEAGAVADLLAGRQRAFDAFRSRQRAFYRAETRWPGSPFWFSRQQTGPGPVPGQQG